MAIPNVPSVVTVSPSTSGNDDTKAIQAAIDKVAALPAKNGIKGAVLLKSGVFNIRGTLVLQSSGVILRGSGSSANGTTLSVIGDPRSVLQVGTESKYATSGTVNITDSYVPSGTKIINVANASRFKAGDSIIVSRPVTQAWVEYMGMDNLTRDGQHQTWIAVGENIDTDRTIASINGNAITLDAPMSDSIDAKYIPGATVSKYTIADRYTQMGVEDLRIITPTTSTGHDSAQFTGLDISNIADCWFSNLYTQELYEVVRFEDNTSKRITFQDIDLVRTTAAVQGSGRPIVYKIMGTQILVQRCSISGDAVDAFSSGPEFTGPNVYLNTKGSGTPNKSNPHQRWATGLLNDNFQSTGKWQVLYGNNDIKGTGHGWSIGWGVIWNIESDDIEADAPPGSQQWSIGNIATKKNKGTGVIESSGSHVGPDSLYIFQLCNRLGPDAVSNIGY